MLEPLKLNIIKKTKPIIGMANKRDKPKYAHGLNGVYSSGMCGSMFCITGLTGGGGATGVTGGAGVYPAE